MRLKKSGQIKCN